MSSSSPSDHRSPHWQDEFDAYVALCHDDPIVASDEACQYLAEALMDIKSPLALSERLVNGLRQATARSSTMADSATPAGYSILALAVFLRIPLLCCQATEIGQVRTLLGSYRGPPAPPFMENVDDAENDENNNDRFDLNHPLLQENHALGNGHAIHDDPDPMAEVWADESDPSDYEFESAIHEYQQQRWEDVENQFYCNFDPLDLSKPPKSTDNETDNDENALGQAVVNLLTELVYHKLAPLANSSNNNNRSINTSCLWNKWQISDFLTQLTLTLLVPPTKSHQRSCLLRDSNPSLASAAVVSVRADWRRWGLEAMWVLRDAALAHPPKHLADYLTLLQTMLAVDGAAAADKTSTHQLLQPTQSSQLPHDATMVGFAAFSSLCHEILNRKEHKALCMTTTRKCLLGCIDDLAQILSKVLSQNPPDNTTLMQVVWNLLPLLDLIIGIRGSEDGSLLGLTSSGLSNAEAQALLNSSFFREILFLYIATKSVTSPSVSEAESSAPTPSTYCRPLGRCIAFLMASSPNLLSKYAWRVPQFTPLVLDDGVSGLGGGEQEVDVVDRLLWNVLGAVAAAADQGGTAEAAPKVVWKTTKPVKPTTNLKDCLERVWARLESLMDGCIVAMGDLKQIRLLQQQLLTASAPPSLPCDHPIRTFKSKRQTMLQSFTFLTCSFQSSQPLAQGFVQTVLIQSNKREPFQSKLKLMQDAISQLPPPVIDSTLDPLSRQAPSQQTKSDNDADNADHDDKTRTTGRRDAALWENQEDCVSRLRKDIKVMSSLLLGPAMAGNVLTDGISLNDITEAVSSKTD